MDAMNNGANAAHADTTTTAASAATAGDALREDVTIAAGLADADWLAARRDMARKHRVPQKDMDRLRREEIRKQHEEAEAARALEASAEVVPDASPPEPPADLDAEIERLARLSPAEWGAERAEAAMRLGMTRADLDKAVKAWRANARAERDAAARAAPPPRTGEVAWPAWIKHRPEGLYADAGEEAPPHWLSDPFDVLGECRGGDGTGWGLVLRWRDRDGRLKSWPMPSRLLMLAPGELEAALVDRGLRVSGDPAARLHLRRALAEVKAGTRVLEVHRAGWHGAGGAALTYMQSNGEPIGDTAEELIYDPGQEGAARCATAGTLEGWQVEVAARAVGNPLSAFCIAAAFAGPLLLPCAEPSGGFHLFGGSKSGKTTAFKMAATVWGPPRKGAVLRDWNTTGNALEVAAEEAGDGLLLLDEVHQADARMVTSAVYDLAAEGGKSRLTREAKARPRRSWRTFALSNGEIDLATVARKAGQHLPAGAAVRFPSVRVQDGGAAWPNLHGALDFQGFARDLHSAMEQHHGHAAPAFIAKLAETMAEGEAVREVLGQARRHFAGLLPADADTQSLDVARRFAMVAAAGDLAAHWGFLPWQLGEAVRAAESVFASWLAGRGGAGAAEDAEAVQRARGFLALHGEARFAAVNTTEHGVDAGDGRVTVQRAGFRKTINSETVYLFFPDVWTGEVFNGADGKAGAAALKRAGFLMPGDGGAKLQRRERVPGFNGGNGLRFYAVRGAILEGEDGAA